MNHNDIDWEDLEGEQLDIAEVIGLEAYRKLCEVYAGSNIYIAKLETTLRKKRDKKILLGHLAGEKFKALAVKYHLGESSVRIIVNEQKHNEKKRKSS